MVRRNGAGGRVAGPGIAALLMVACSDRGAPGRASTRDSAGVQIVENAGAWPRPGERANRFTVLDSTGAVIGAATMPERFRATTIGHGLVAGVWRDPDDIEHVRVYRVQRSGGS